MIRFILLLLGAEPLRKHWRISLLAGFFCLAAGIIFAGDLLHPAEIVTVDVIGIILAAEGAVRLIALAAIGFPNALPAVLKSLGFFALGFMAIDVPADNNIVATIILGSAFAIDGLFRIAAALVIRAAHWRAALLTGGFELIVSALIATPWPVPYRNTVPFCLGIGLLAAAWSLMRLGLQLRKLRPGASVTDLPLFAGPNWHGRGILHPSQILPASWDNAAPLTVHIWTPAGSAINPHRRLVIDRYIAAIDQNGVISTGHAALSLPPDDYVSLCPAQEIDRSPDEFGRLLRAGPENDVPGVFRPSLAEECGDWRLPDREIRFHRYNAEALRAFLMLYRQRQIYNLTSRNCSSTVALSLDAAVEGVLGRGSPWRTALRLLTDPAMWLLVLWRARAEAMTWTPGLILDYAQTLQTVLSGRRQHWFARLRVMRLSYAERRRALVAEAVVPPASTRWTVLSLMASGIIFGLAYGLSAPLLAFDLMRMGFDESLIGINAAMHAIGVLAIAPFLPGIAWRNGPKLSITVALLTVAAMLALFPAMPSVWLWFPLRIALGAAGETVMVMSETWLSELIEEKNRTRMMALYTTALSIGFALGPVILTVMGDSGVLPYLTGSVIVLVTLLAIAMPWMRVPVLAQATYRGMGRYLALAPVAIGATLLNATLETAGSSLLPLYAMRIGWGEESATLLLSVLLLGAIVLQIPIGWLGDRLKKKPLAIGLGMLAAAGALLWPLAIHRPLLAYPLLFLWGGIVVGLYTLTISTVGSRFRGADLVSIYTVMSIAWGAGAFIGPSIGGLAMDAATHGLAYFAAAACAAFVLLALLRHRGV